MKHLIILTDGLADHPIDELGGMTPVEYAPTPNLDRLAASGRTGMLLTVPEGMHPGSEIANATIMGYDMRRLYEGRGVLEAASIGVDLAPDDLAMRCNILTLSPDTILNHHGGHLTSDEGAEIIMLLQEALGSDRVKFVAGTQYRHLLIIRGGSKYIECAPPHDHPDCQWRPLLVRPVEGAPVEEGRLIPQETASLINDLILRSASVIAEAPSVKARRAEGRTAPTHIWPWSPGYRPEMLPLAQIYPDAVKTGTVISAVDLIRGLGRYAGLTPVEVEGATGLVDTNYEGKVAAAIEALQRDDYVYLHIEACDEAGHDGSLPTKLEAIRRIDSRVVGPLLDAIARMSFPVAVALLPDHATPVEERVHRGEPVPFVISAPGLTPDSVTSYSERACAHGHFGTLSLTAFADTFMAV